MTEYDTDLSDIQTAWSRSPRLRLAAERQPAPGQRSATVAAASEMGTQINK